MKNSRLQLQHFNKALTNYRGLLRDINCRLQTVLFHALFFFLLTLTCLPATAQSFPVQVIPQVTPPAPIYFSDYADATTLGSPLRVQIILNDFEIANREIRLRTYFEGGGISFHSNDVVLGAEKLYLEGGVPLVLTNVQLAPYFSFENISGISPNVYGKAIPEGAYSFCFEVYDVLTGNRLSQKSCATSVVFQNEPPFLVAPRNKSNLTETNPQNIVFQWTPRHINVSNVEYELSIVEIWDTQVDPQQAFLSSPPVFQVTTTATTYVYGPADPLFLSGKNYAWRVQAKAKQGVEEIGLFKNQGYSEIYSFSYAGTCDLPIRINHEVKGSTNANIFWDDFATDVPEYTVRYRQKNIEGAEWFMNKTTSNQTTLWDLKAGTTYEYQIQKQCAVTGSDWSTAKEFTTFIADDEASVYDCGITPDFDVSNKEPLPSISSGEKFMAGDFPINILKVSGKNGRFTGKGYVTIPYLNSIRVGVEFTNVLINTDKKLAEGTVVTTYDPSLKNILDVDESVDTVEDAADAVGEFFEGDNDLDEIRVNWVLRSKKDIKIKGGKVVITNPNTGATKSEPLGDDMVITDSEGKTYYVDAEGKITEGGSLATGGAISPDTVEGVSNNGQIEALTAEGVLVTFNEAGTYAMDIMPKGEIGKLKDEYTIIKDADGNDYVLTHHAVKNRASTKIKAKIDIKNDAYDVSDVIFKTKHGDSIPTTFKGNEATLTLKGRFTFENEVIYAVVPNKDDSTKQLTAGAFTLWHLSERTVNVALVSVNGASLGNIESNVSDIFKKAVAHIEFGESLALSVTKDELGSNQKLDVGESAWAAAYNEEQKMLINKVKQLPNYKTDTYYVLVFNDIEPSESIGGFMPLQRQMGFVFGGDPDDGEDKNGDKSKTLAHEIGHGIFALQHPFAEYDMSENQTDWLMDYGSGDQLPHTHWAQIHDPALKFYIFQDEEDGEGTFPDPIMVKRYIERYRCAYKSGEIFKYDSTEPSIVWAKNITIGGVEYDELRIEILKNNSPFIPTGYSDDIYSNSNGSGVDTSWSNKNIINFKNFFRIHFPKNKIGAIASYLYPSDEQWKKHLDATLQKVTSLGAEDDKELLKTISPCLLRSISVVKRVDLINRLAEGTTTETKEEIILDLVEHINASEIDAFLILLAGTPYRAKVNTSLLHALINDEINDSYLFGDDNLQILIQALTRLAKKSNAFENKFKSLSADDIRHRMINYDYKSIWERLGNYGQLQNYGFTYSIKTDVSMEQLNSKITIKSTLMDGGFIPFKELSKKTFDAFEPIIFINKSNLSMLDIYDNETYQVVPALVAKYADKKAWNKTTSDIINATVDAVSLATGYGEVKVAITGIRKALIITDMVNSGVNLTLNVTGSQENLPENAQKVLTAFNVLSGAIGAVETMAGKNIDQIFKSVDKSSTLPQKYQAQTFINNIINADQDLSKLSSGEIESLKWMANRLKIDAKLNNLTEFEKAIDEAIDILNNLANVFEDIVRGVSKSKFIGSIDDFINGSNTQIAEQAWDLWKKQKWTELEKLFKDNNLNGGWPPNDGFKSISHIESGSELSGKTFDRFQGYENLGGKYASPVKSGEGVGDLVFTYDSRALISQIQEGTYYLKFKLKNNLPVNLTFEYGEAIPWFGTLGNADQIKSSYKFSDLIEDVHYDVIEKLVYQNGQWITIIP
ncbi:fibronectin type III domain-containing protein [Zobellia galactanivorans]|uniref:fibronectin type III domain-containing protein n=1 Tax=Zobellia galactanivorans (strain DSM 12802 / CCUG 47099 / CIP 106680 / NCIMB 13871 / Dsij) TaxID=63186 RepID=UPI0026E14C4F|nr:fibronectin type III domain-containing protein [Zobellia galactanivorans]MDO6808360.1 fibronectin type III domain-containing protein [Zobellia galactanivorans]